MKIDIGVVIGRNTDGEELKELEFILDKDKDYLHFDSVEEAEQYLLSIGESNEHDKNSHYVFLYHTFCLNCGHEYFLYPSETFVDELGRGYYCKLCDSSFDII